MTVLFESPLLIARGARSGGGSGGRRISVELRDAQYVVVISGSGPGPAPGERAVAGTLQAVQAYNQALRESGRAGLTSRPEPVALSVDALDAARAARNL